MSESILPDVREKVEILPEEAIIEPLISIPAEDADSTVFVELVFISKAVELIDICSPLVSPIVVVDAKLAS